MVNVINLVKLKNVTMILTTAKIRNFVLMDVIQDLLEMVYVMLFAIPKIVNETRMIVKN